MLTAAVVLIALDVVLSAVALVRSVVSDRRLHTAIKHPVRVHGPVK